MIVACLVYAVLLGLINFIMSSCTCWAAWLNAWLPIELMPNGVVFSFLFFSFHVHVQHQHVRFHRLASCGSKQVVLP